jgi:hypothetical protein
MRSVSPFLVATTITFVAAGVAALALVLLPLVFFVAIVASCALLALVGAALTRKDTACTQREAIAEAQAARLADLNGRADVLKARERAVESVQMAVLRSVRREHGP